MNEEKTNIITVKFDARDYIPEDATDIIETVNVSGGGEHEEKEVISNEISE